MPLLARARKPRQVGQEVAVSLQGIDSARPLWEVIQAHNLRDYNKGCDGCRTPSASEERSMAWQAVCRGANGVVCCPWGAATHAWTLWGGAGRSPARMRACVACAWIRHT